MASLEQLAGDGGQTTSTAAGAQLRTMLQGREEAIFDLVCAGATLGQWADWLRVPLEHAVAAGNTGLVTKLREAGARGVAVHASVGRGQEALVREMWRLGAASPSELDESGDTPLHVAANLGYNGGMISTSVRHGADVDALGGGSRTPLHLAAGQNQVGAINLLVEGGADVGAAQEVETCGTPLHSAARLGSAGAVVALLGHRADANKLNGDEYTALHLAAEDGNAAAVQALLSAGAEFDRRGGRKKNTPLCLAAKGGHVDVLTALMEHGASLNTTDASGRTAVHTASSNNHVAVIDALIAAGARVDLEDKKQQTPLHSASACGSAEAIAALIRHGSRSNQLDADGRAPLHLAVRSNSAAATEALLVAGADVKLRDKNGSSALYTAVLLQHGDVVRVLVRHSADVKERTLDGPILFTAASGSCVEIVDVLVAAGAQLGAIDVLGATALHVACRKGSSTVVLALLKHGADPTKRKNNGCGVIHEATEGRNIPAIEATLAAGADVNLGDNWGVTALHVAALYAPIVVETLLRHGADPDCQASDGRTALHNAAWKGGDCLSIDALIDGGATIEARNKYGQTPLHVSTFFFWQSYERTVVQALLRSGADVNAKDNGGCSPLHLLAIDSDDMIVEVAGAVDLLLSYGADEHATDSFGKTAAAHWEESVEDHHLSSADAALVRRLLADADKDRAWRRRGWLVLVRACPDRVRLRVESGRPEATTLRVVRARGIATTGSRLGSTSPHNVFGAGLSSVVSKVVGFQEEGVFRNVVEFL